MLFCRIESLDKQDGDGPRPRLRGTGVVRATRSAAASNRIVGSPSATRNRRRQVLAALSWAPSRFRTYVRLSSWGCRMDDRLRRVLAERVEAYLREVERVLRGADPGMSWPAVRARLLPLAAGWRSLLVQHRSGLRGRCRHCDRAARPWQSRSGSCSVWRTAHAHLVGGWPVGGGQ
jgi:heme exporter protein D